MELNSSGFIKTLRIFYLNQRESQFGNVSVEVGKYTFPIYKLIYDLVDYGQSKRIIVDTIYEEIEKNKIWSITRKECDFSKDSLEKIIDEAFSLYNDGLLVSPYTILEAKRICGHEPERIIKSIYLRVRLANTRAKDFCQDDRINFVDFLEIVNNKKWRCQICGNKLKLALPQGRFTNKYIMSLDHIVAMNKGGLNVIENITCLCKSCNDKKDS